VPRKHPTPKQLNYMKEACRLLKELLNGLEIALTKEGDTFGIWHNDVTDSMIEVERFLKEHDPS